MSRRGEPFPTRRTGNFVRLQLANASGKIARAVRHEPRKERARAADRWVGWGIVRFSSQVWHLEPVRENRHVPVFSQRQGRSGVIEMTMREHDRLRRNAGAESRFGRFNDLVGPSRKSDRKST